MDSLAQQRNRIDKIDREILVRLKARSEAAQLIGQIKESRGLPIRVHRREEQILRRIRYEAERLGLSPGRTQNVFREIVKLGIDAQLQLEARNPPALKERYRCLILGGTGEMGRLFASMMKREGAQVGIVGREKRSTLRTARQLGVHAAKLEDATESDAVIVSVPAAVTAATATEAGRLMRSGSVLTDISSVKTGIADRIATSTPSRVDYVSVHPLFGPAALTLHGQSILTIPYRARNAWYRFRKKLLNAGFFLTETTADKHDQIMGYVQVAHHFALLSLGSSLADWDGSYKTNSLISTLERLRTLSESPATVLAIQQLNPYAARARHEFLEAGRKLSKMNNPENWIRDIAELVQKWSRKR